MNISNWAALVAEMKSHLDPRVAQGIEHCTSGLAFAQELAGPTIVYSLGCIIGVLILGVVAYYYAGVALARTLSVLVNLALSKTFKKFEIRSITVFPFKMEGKQQYLLSVTSFPTA
jgi:hypothetical protein